MALCIGFHDGRNNNLSADEKTLFGRLFQDSRIFQTTVCKYIIHGIDKIINIHDFIYSLKSTPKLLSSSFRGRNFLHDCLLKSIYFAIVKCFVTILVNKLSACCLIYTLAHVFVFPRLHKCSH